MNTHNLKVHIADICSFIREDWPDDPQALLDGIEGETDALEVITRLLESAGEQAGYAEGLSQYINIVQTRKQSHIARAQKLEQSAKEIAASIIVETGSNIKLPIATISMRKNKPRIADIDESSLPEQFFKVKKAADRTAIQKAIDEGDAPKGVQVTNGSPSITVRRK